LPNQTDTTLLLSLVAFFGLMRWKGGKQRA